MTIDFIPNAPTPQNNPAIDFIPNAQQPQNPNSFLNSIARPIAVGGTQFGANIAGDVFSGLQNPKLMGAFGGPQMQALTQQFSQYLPQQSTAPQQLMQNVAQNAPQMFGMNNPNFSQNLLSGIAQSAPYGLVAPELGASKVLSDLPSIFGRMLTPGKQVAAQIGGLYGATQSQPGQAGMGALENAGGAYALSNIPDAWNATTGIYRGIKNAIGGNADTNASQLYQTISGGLPKGDLNKVNTNNVIENYQDQNEASKKAYNDFKNTVAQNGYATSGSPGKPAAQGLFGETIPATKGDPGKFIIPSQPVVTQLQSFLKNDPTTSGIKDISGPVKSKITNYLASPTFNNAHDLQSSLGEEAADFRSGFVTDKAEKKTAGALDDARQSVRNNIINNFTNYNTPSETQVASQLQDLSNQNISPNLKSSINSYLTSPSFDTTAQLHGALGDEIKNTPDQGMSDNLSNTKASVRNMIGKYTNTDTYTPTQPDTSLADHYKTLSDNFRDNVAPYRKKAQIWNAIRGKDFPQNIANVLSRDDKDGTNAYDAIRSHIMQNPDQSQTLLAQALGRKASIGTDKTYSITANNLTNSYNNLPTNLSKFGESLGMDSQINSLSKQAGRFHAAKEFGKYAGIAGGISALATVIPGIKNLKELI